MATVLDRRLEALAELEGALEERDLAQERFEQVVGTSAEMGAYLRLRRATRRLAAADRFGRREAAGESERLPA